MHTRVTHDGLTAGVPNSTASAGPLFGPLPPRQALRQNVLVSLLKAIFNGHLREADWLNAHKLAEQFGVSATPVREALVELATIGIIEMQHNKGTVVRPFGLVQLKEIYHLRRVLEAEATRCACGRIPPEKLAELKDEMNHLLKSKNGTNWSERAMASDRHLHDLIASHCGSQRLAEEIGRYNTLVQCIRDVVGDQSYAQQQALPEHLEIINRLLEGNANRAAAAMAEHIDSTARAVSEALFASTASAENRPNQ